MVDEDEDEEDEDALDVSGRRSVHGTATSSPLELPMALELDVDPMPLCDPGVVLWLCDPELLDPVPDMELEVELPAPIPLREMTANSTLPDEGFRITSSIWPIRLPDEPLTSAPMTSLARTACWECELNPVELNERWLEELLLPNELSEDDWPDCVWLDCPG